MVPFLILLSILISNNDTNITKKKGVEINDSEVVSKEKMV
jgi:hypothetical protein